MNDITKQTIFNIHLLENQEWYRLLVEDIKATVVEAIHASRWILVEGYWTVGQRIREDENVKKYAKGSAEFLARLAKNVGLSTRTLYYSLQAYDKYPDIQKIPEGKNISWNKLITKYLPQKQENIVHTPLPSGEYDVIYADPPWKYDFSETTSREIENKYDTLNLEELKNMIIPVSENAVLFLWATAPKLNEAMELIKAWGFEYKSNMIWDKEVFGMGYWFRGQHEILLVATRGIFSPPEPEFRRRSVYSEKRGDHSKKPNYFYDLIETYFPNGNYLELFARQKYNDKWTVWGNEI